MIQAIKVSGLLHRYDVSVNLIDAPTFLIGPNGSGKTTLIKCIFYLLTGQWSELDKLPFDEITIFTEKSEISIEREYIKFVEEIDRSTTQRPFLKRQLSSLPQEFDAFFGASALRTPRRTALLQRYSRDGMDANYPTTLELLRVLDSTMRESVLYFPTYRRVERDLSEFFHDGDASEDYYGEETALLPVVRDRFERYGEVVGFGGQDITKLIGAAAEEVRDRTNQSLNAHSIRFLESLAKGDKRTNKNFREQIFKGDVVSNILQRLENFGGKSIAFSAVQEQMDNIKRKIAIGQQGRLTQKEDMLIFYFDSLRELFIDIDTHSVMLQKFAHITDKYLSPRKKVQFSPFTNNISISTDVDDDISFDSLSSGEKQIVAFFAFLAIASKANKKVLLLDEPELSLSVDWQLSLISDMRSISPAASMIIATHSPFIFERFGLGSVIEIGA